MTQDLFEYIPKAHLQTTQALDLLLAISHMDVDRERIPADELAYLLKQCHGAALTLRSAASLVDQVKDKLYIHRQEMYGIRTPGLEGGPA